ncbi:hypothetical protein BD769DRAFT_1395086 [Suillus cothurnatus]|nr:hypothetical protein BD769DRAFT_1395086 [Suillus cothurnatus]
MCSISEASLNLTVYSTNDFNSLGNPWALNLVEWKHYLLYCGLLVLKQLFVIVALLKRLLLCLTAFKSIEVSWNRLVKRYHVPTQWMFFKKTAQGKVIKVLREWYAHEYEVMYHSDTLQMDLIESTYFTLILQAVMEEVHHRSLPSYSRLKALAMTDERKYGCFTMSSGQRLPSCEKKTRCQTTGMIEVGIQTCIIGYTNKIYMGIRKAALWYNMSLKITKKEARRESHAFQPLSSIEVTSTQTNKTTLRFAMNASADASTDFFQGTIPVPAFTKLVLLVGRENMNRAVQGDVVVVGVFDEIDQEGQPTG